MVGLFYLLCILIVTPYEAARILAVFPVPSISHQVVFRPLTQELVKRGHEVTVITTDPVFTKEGAPRNLTEIDVHQVSYQIWKESFIKAATKGNKDDILTQWHIILKTFAVVFEAQIKTDAVQRVLKNKSKKYDLLLLEACVRPALAFTHVYKNIPVILVSSLGALPGNYELIGASVHPLLYPTILHQRLYNLSYWEKFFELYKHYGVMKIIEKNGIFENSLLSKNFGADIPSVEEMGNRVDLLLLNVHPVFEGIRPVPPSVIYTGGLHLKPPKELPAYISVSAHVKMSVLYLVACVLVLNLSSAARILAVFPVPSISHQVVFRPLTQELAKRGHEVTVITPDPVFTKGGAPPNLTEIDVHDISYDIWKENFMKVASKGNKDDHHSQLYVILNTFAVVFDAQIKTDAVQRILKDKSKKYDLLLLEACVRPALAFTHAFKDVPTILVSSLGAVPGNYELIGAAVHPLLYPSLMQQKLYNLSLWEKLAALYAHYQTIKTYEKNEDLDNSVVKSNFGSDVASVEELGNNVDMLLLNINPIFEGIRPVPPSVVYMGGIHQKPPKDLPADIQSYLDSSKNGVIYISFGTNVAPSMLPPDRIQIMLKVLSQLPYDVMWKWDKDELPGRSANIKISKWFPQPDLLRHPKVKLFITQGGLQSTDEAITTGVPLIGIPMLADQWFNVEKYVYHKIGVQLGLETLTEEKFKDAITTVIGDDSYRRNIEKLRSVIQDEPMRPLERAMWWIEHVIRNKGAKHLRSPAANLTWWKYLELDLVLILLAGLLIIVIGFFTILYKLYKKFFCTNIKLKSN